MGNPNLYRVRLSLQKEGNAIDQLEFDYGIRTVEQISSAGPRTADAWGNWQFVVNGRKLFVKGMNWVPVDVLLDVTEDRYRWTLEAAKNMGIQLIRVWGAGLLETDTFYRICNELGIMVWQDFPIGNQDTPDFPKDVWEAQVVQNIFRIRNNPCLVAWCGGNEFNPYSFGNTASIGIIERNLNIFDKTRLFLRADPDNGSLHTYPDLDPCWYNRVYKFTPWITETGIPAMPEANLVYEVVDNKEFFDLGKKWDYNFYKSHPELTHHVMKRDPVSIGSVLKYASHFEDMINPTIESATEASQVGAGEFYQIISEKMQSNYPVTTGLMPWVFKRHWTFLIAHQMMDWFGQPGGQYYFLKRTYEPTHIALDLPRLLWAPMDQIQLITKVMHANQNSFSGIVSVTVFNDQFQKLHYREKEVEINEGPSVTSTEMGDFQIPTGYRNRFLFLVTELKRKNGEVISRSVYQPRSLEQMENQVFHDKFVNEPVPWIALGNGPWLKPTVSKTRTKLTAEVVDKKTISADRSKIIVRITNKGKVPAFLTKINIEGIKRAFFASDNYFWLNPGEVKEVIMEILWREEKSDQKIMVVADAWNADKKPVSIK
jgi:beta-mannosidase